MGQPCPGVISTLCSHEDTDCVRITGNGETNAPFSLEFIFDEDPANLAECNPSGVGVFCPSLICDPPRAKLKRTTVQTIPHATPQLVVFTTEVYDSAGMVDISNEPGRLSIVEDGLYIIHLILGWEEPTGSAFASATVYNQPAGAGVLTDARYILPGLGDPTPRLSVSEEAELDAGTYLEVQVYQNTGTDDDVGLNLVGAILTARYVGPKV